MISSCVLGGTNKPFMLLGEAHCIRIPPQLRHLACATSSWVAHLHLACAHGTQQLAPEAQRLCQWSLAGCLWEHRYCAAAAVVLHTPAAAAAFMHDVFVSSTHAISHGHHDAVRMCACMCIRGKVQRVGHS